MAAIHCARLGQFTQDDVKLLCSFFFLAPVRQVAMATAQVLFHRFFYSKSFVKHSFEVSVLRVSGVLPGRCRPVLLA